MKTIEKSDLFFCYDVALHRVLKQQGYKYLLSAISNSNRRFWLYDRNQVNHIVEQHAQGN